MRCSAGRYPAGRCGVSLHSEQSLLIILTILSLHLRGVSTRTASRLYSAGSAVRPASRCPAVSKKLGGSGLFTSRERLSCQSFSGTSLILSFLQSLCEWSRNLCVYPYARFTVIMPSGFCNPVSNHCIDGYFLLMTYVKSYYLNFAKKGLSVHMPGQSISAPYRANGSPYLF